MLKIKERIPPNFSLTTVSEAERQLLTILKQTYLDKDSFVRLKNGYLQGYAVEHKYIVGCKFKLVGSSQSTKADNPCRTDGCYMWRNRRCSGSTLAAVPNSFHATGRKPLVDGVASLLVNPYTGTPITIGLFGDWGTGKSSFMSQVEDTLLCMSVKETFKKTTPSEYELLLGEESSDQEFSDIGRVLREKVVQYFQNRNAQENSVKSKVNKAPSKLKSLQNRNAQENRLTQWGAILRSKLNAVLSKYMPKTKQDASNNIQPDIDFTPELQSQNRQLFKDLALMDRSKLVRRAISLDLE